jgi:hypothetical protein
MLIWSSDYIRVGYSYYVVCPLLLNSLDPQEYNYPDESQQRQWSNPTETPHIVTE